MEVVARNDSETNIKLNKVLWIGDEEKMDTLPYY